MIKRKMVDYSNKIIVAPMVRVSTLPFRLLCLDYGADYVYSEETIDFKMLKSVKKENDMLGTTDFVDKLDGTVFFRTCAKEKEKLIFQIGTCSSHRALKVAKLVEDYVAGIDVNMGCPKEFSLKGGMGAALLTQPEKVKDILSTLCQNLSIPVTCKIRILDSLEETISLCKLIEACGVAALAVHGRTKSERPNHANHNDVIKEIAKAVLIPVIANGGSKDIENLDDVERFRRDTGAAGVMVARAAMWNCSLLRREGKLNHDTVIKEFLKYCIQYDNPFTYSKYTVQNILRDLQSTDRGKAFLETQTLQEICVLWGLKDYFNEFMLRHSETITERKLNTRSCAPRSIENIVLEERREGGCTVFEMPLQFIRGNYANADLPKMVLNTYIFKNDLKKPIYTCQVVDKVFCSTLEIEGVLYRSSIKEKCRRYAEQGAAFVFLHAKKLVHETYGFVPSFGTRKYSCFDSSELIAGKGKKRDFESVENWVDRKTKKLSEIIL